MNKIITFSIVIVISILIVVFVIKKYSLFPLINCQQAVVINKIEDISDEFVITPDQEYSLSNKVIIIPPSKFTAPIIPEQLEITTKVNNSFPKPLWAKGKDCNYHGVLEKKTITGWVIMNEEECQEEKSSIPGRFFNNGFNELHHAIFTEDAKGEYRIRINLLIGCKASRDSGNNIEYGNCDKEVISYSPVFSVVD